MTILPLRLLLNFCFDWEDVWNTRDIVSSAIQTPRISSKILRCASYFPNLKILTLSHQVRCGQIKTFLSNFSQCSMPTYNFFFKESNTFSCKNFKRKLQFKKSRFVSQAPLVHGRIISCYLVTRLYFSVELTKLWA